MASHTEAEESRIRGGLLSSIHEEKTAVNTYLGRAAAADGKTRTLYEHIAEEERRHAREFTNRLNDFYRAAGSELLPK